MPPSPQADQGIEKLPSARRASSLPPENIRPNSRPSIPISVIKQLRRLRIPDNDDAMDGQENQEDGEGAIEIEELSPDAIVPDHIQVMRDPEIETPREDEGDDSGQRETDVMSTNAGDRMSGGTGSDEGDDGDDEGEAMDETDGYATPEKPKPARKRKYSGDGGDGQGRARKRHFKPWMSSPG